MRSTFFFVVVLVALSSITRAAPSTTSPADARLVVLNDFSDNGLITGPRTIWIYLPKDYATSKEMYRVIYFHDGNGLFLDGSPHAGTDHAMMADVAYDQLMDRGLIEPAILVGIDSAKGDNRTAELTTSGKTKTTGGRIEDYFQFMTTCVKKYVDEHYRTKKEPEFTGVAGSSFGGLASFYLGYYHSDVFGMAGCMSTSLWWDRQKLVNAIAADDRPKKPVRFWMGCGFPETDEMWSPGLRAAGLLLKKGWREGDDLGFYLDYSGEHNSAAWASQMPQMLLFLLGKQRPQLAGIAIKSVSDPLGKPIHLLSLGDVPFATLELQYDNGLRFNAIDPQFAIDYPQVCTIKHGDMLVLTNHGHGVATISANYGGRTALQTVIGYGPDELPSYPRLPLTKLDKPPAMDGTLTGWDGVPSYLITDGNSPIEAVPPRKFSVGYDDRFVYVTVSVVDPHVVSQPKKIPWTQDGVELRMDARPDPIRFYSTQETRGSYFTLTASPSADGSGVYQPDRFPPGVVVICKPTADGYIFQASVPTMLLDAAQGSAWKEFRLNLCVDDVSEVGGHVDKYWWQPHWRTPQNRPGSGTFQK